MSWFKKFKRTPNNQSTDNKSDVCEVSLTNICKEAFKSHWRQLLEVLTEYDSEISNGQNKEKITEHINIVKNLLESMVCLLVEEQTQGEILGSVLEYAITEEIFNKLYEWCASLYHDQTFLVFLLKMYEVLISQAQNSLLHHKQVIVPLTKLLSLPSDSDETDSHRVMVLNLLCVWMKRDPTLLDVFFHPQNETFQIFTSLTNYIHREGTVGQQARDALLLCISLSCNNEVVADFITRHSNFAPVLAIGLSGLYSTLPRHIDIQSDEWHCLQKSDWAKVPELTNFMNSFEFCNSVVEVCHPSIADQLVDFIEHGFLVGVFGPSLHKTSVSEVIVTTAYLNLFLQSATSDKLLKCFIKFLLTHCHDNALIINTLIQRINSSNRLSLVSLSLVRTLINLNCEDLMLQLIFRYLMPCNHVLASQKKAISDVDLHNSSAQRFLALTPISSLKNHNEDLTRPLVKETIHEESSMPTAPDLVMTSQAAESSYVINEDLSVTIDMHASSTDNPEKSNDDVINDPMTMAEFGSDLNSRLQLTTSYMDYLEDARTSIRHCRDACVTWSARYDGNDDVVLDDIATGSWQETRMTDDDDVISSALTVTQQTLKLTKLAFQQNDVKSENFKDEKSPNLPEDPKSPNLPEDPKSPNIPEDPKSQNLPEDPKSPNLPEDLKSPNLPEDPKSPNLPKDPKSPNLPEDPKSPNLPEGPKSPNLPKDPKSPNLPKDPKSPNLPEDPKSPNLPKDPKSPNLPEDPKSPNLPEGPKSPNLPKDPKSPNLPKDPKSPNLPEDPKSPNLPKDPKSPNLPEDPKSPNLPEDPRSPNLPPEVSKDPTTASSVDEFFRSLMEIVPKFQERSEEECEDSIETVAMTSSDDQTISSSDDDVITSRNTSFDDYDAISVTSSSFYDYKPSDVTEDEGEIWIEPVKMRAMPFTGPLMVTLFGKLDHMITNSLYENLLLTDVITRIAIYPHPLTRSFLLNTRMVFHPSVRSLYQVLTNVRNKLMTSLSAVSDAHLLIARAHKYLLARGDVMTMTSHPIACRPMPVPKVKTRMRQLLMRKKRSNVDESVKKSGVNSTFYVKQSTSEVDDDVTREAMTKNAIYASIIFEEFLKELAAVSQEHAVAL